MPKCAYNGWGGNGEEYSEDCLSVNIYADKRKIESGEQVPIVYFIHGGAFTFGTNQADFKNLVENQGVIVISIAYRLAIYGFLWSSNSYGNFGLGDQRLAMKWAQTWAPHFGGDISQATLNGCSAGSESVWWHLTQEGSWPYFHRAVTVGVGLNTANDMTVGQGVFDSMLTETGCTDINCLRTIPAGEIRTATSVAKLSTVHPTKLILESTTGPVVDGVTLTAQLFDSVKNGNIRPNTPISWNYAENDAFGFVDMAWGNLQKIPNIAALASEITAAQESSGLNFPSDFFNQWLANMYPAGPVLDGILSQFRQSTKIVIIQIK